MLYVGSRSLNSNSCLGSTHVLCFCGGESNCGLLLGTPRDGCSISHENIASCGPPVLSSTPVSIHITREGDLPSLFRVGDGGGKGPFEVPEKLLGHTEVEGSWVGSISTKDSNCKSDVWPVRNRRGNI
jgi:hypothetical protein